VPDAGIKVFLRNLIFLLAIFGPIVHSREKLQGVCQEKLAGALNQNKKNLKQTTL
jgi:hypothetical protein